MTNIENLKEVREALATGKMCAELLVKKGGACGCEISEEELPRLNRALKTLDTVIEGMKRPALTPDQREELVEEMAIGIYQANNTHCYEWRELATSTQEWYLDQAKAALAIAEIRLLGKQ